MKLEQSFEVAAPLERVWAALIDVERVAPCLPGASVTGRNDDGSYNGNFKVKIGPTSAAYTGKLMMEDVDESAHTATMQAQGTDKRGQGGAKATIVSSVGEGAEGAGSTRVEVVTDYHITGRLARFGRGGMIEDISNRLLGEFAKCLQTSLAGAEETAPAEAPASPARRRCGRRTSERPPSPRPRPRRGREASEAAAARRLPRRPPPGLPHGRAPRRSPPIPRAPRAPGWPRPSPSRACSLMASAICDAGHAPMPAPSLAEGARVRCSRCGAVRNQVKRKPGPGGRHRGARVPARRCGSFADASTDRPPKCARPAGLAQ